MSAGCNRHARSFGEKRIASYIGTLNPVSIFVPGKGDRQTVIDPIRTGHNPASRRAGACAFRYRGLDGWSRVAILCLAMALGTVALPAQSLPLMPITTGDGLSQGMAFALVQDTKGFIWAGTKDGLSRYDGYSFRVFRHDPFDTLTLRDNRIRLLHVDRSGRIWVSTESGLGSTM